MSAWYVFSAMRFLSYGNPAKGIYVKPMIEKEAEISIEDEAFLVKTVRLELIVYMCNRWRKLNGRLAVNFLLHMPI